MIAAEWTRWIDCRLYWWRRMYYIGIILWISQLSLMYIKKELCMHRTTTYTICLTARRSTQGCRLKLICTSSNWSMCAFIMTHGRCWCLVDVGYDAIRHSSTVLDPVSAILGNEDGMWTSNDTCACQQMMVHQCVCADAHTYIHTYITMQHHSWS